MDGEWDELEGAVRRFQQANMAIKYAAKPVVAAPFGMTLGGGCEIAMHAARVPQRHRIALDQLGDRRADGFEPMIAGGQSIGAGEKMRAAVTGRQRVVGVHDLPG